MAKKKNGTSAEAVKRRKGKVGEGEGAVDHSAQGHPVAAGAQRGRDLLDPEEGGGDRLGGRLRLPRQGLGRRLDRAPNRPADGEEGDDTVDGGADTDFIFGEEGEDELIGGDDTDLVVGGIGDDLIYGDGTTGEGNTPGGAADLWQFDPGRGNARSGPATRANGRSSLGHRRAWQRCVQDCRGHPPVLPANTGAI